LDELQYDHDCQEGRKEDEQLNMRKINREEKDTQVKKPET
jgi:hypothetical protein